MEWYYKGTNLFIYGGQADPEEKIQILFAEQKQTVKADSKGYWEVNLKALETGGPYQLQIIGKENPISIKDILIGDVWLCSGQSNMQWVVNNVTNAEVEKKECQLSANPNFKHTSPHGIIP